MKSRVVVFLDYQNVYYGAREAFHPHGAAPQAGQVDPLPLAQAIASDSPFERELAQVRVYRGIPDANRDARGYAATSQQKDAWERHANVEVITRGLRYPTAWPSEKPMEKGIDVALALDFVLMAVRGEYEVGVIMSGDTDLRPALEEVLKLQAGSFPRCEVAAWSSPSGHGQRLSVPGQTIWCHWLDESVYREVEDTTDFGRVT